MNEWMGPRGHNVAVLFSESSRVAYVQQARDREETYTFVDAEGRHRTWLKGQHAYLAANAASVFLARCNLKHDVVNEDQLTASVLASCSALVIPNAGHLTSATIARIEEWMADPRHCLLVTGRTNLPPALLGLKSAQPVEVSGYTGWRWLAGSPFHGPSWEPMYVSGYKGHAVEFVQPAPGSRVLADLLEFSGDLSSAATVKPTRMGAAIVTTARTVYIANQTFELIGGMLQAHLNVEAVRHWAHPTHWGDSLLFFIRQLVLDAGWASLWQTRLRSFGTYQGVLSFRHDVHGMRDYTMLDYQVQNLIPGSYDIEDPGFSTNITEPMARDWVERTTRNSFIEPALHNDSSIGDPPKGIRGKGLFTHVINAEKSLGFMVCTCGRHAGGHMHPETIDAMDYLYRNHPGVLGMCTFCYYHMIEYGVRDPNAVVEGATLGGRELTYITDLRRTIATPGIWFPFHAVVTTDLEWRPLRGWDRTHEYDAAFDLVEDIFGGHHSRNPGPGDRLENGVYSFQYHPELARDPSVNDGRGSLDYLRYCINLAERNEFWIATQKDLYQRMGDYQDLVFEPRGDSEVIVRNPTARRIAAMVIERRAPFASVWQGDDELVHVVRDAFVTLPPLEPAALVHLRFSDQRCDEPMIRQPSNKGITVIDARRHPASGETVVTVSVCRTQPLCIEGVDPLGAYRVQVDDEPACYMAPRVVKTIQAQLSNSKAAKAEQGEITRRTKVKGITTFLDLAIAGHPDNFVERTVRIRQLPAEQALVARAAMLAATPQKTGRVTPYIESIPADE